jgi:hypothetical protein
MRARCEPRSDGEEPQTMSHYFDKTSWVIQLQRTMPNGEKRRICQRVRGTEADAETLEAKLSRQLDDKVEEARRERQDEEKRRKAAATLGLDLTKLESSNDSERPPTLRDFLTGRWAEHAQVSRNATTTSPDSKDAAPGDETFKDNTNTDITNIKGS